MISLSFVRTGCRICICVDMGFVLNMYVFDVSSSDICDNDQEKCSDIRSISKRNTIVFILV
jgi:hypothetical protein